MKCDVLGSGFGCHNNDTVVGTMWSIISVTFVKNNGMGQMLSESLPLPLGSFYVLNGCIFFRVVRLLFSFNNNWREMNKI